MTDTGPDAGRFTPESLFRGKTDSTQVQMFRNLLAGMCSMAVDWALLIALKEACGVHYLLSACAAYAAGTLVRYVFSVAWIFSVRRFSSRRVEFLLFAGVGVAGLGLNAALMWFLTGLAGAHYLLSKAVAMVVLYFWGFFVRKRILFS